ncbi:hypothetical protein AKO1_001292 [Acrasis kona]|uniref:Uncharacterized protein n=1 Tax=Acrasis kona TaxID=1008807 RepID=A0AAW2ZBT8_9EUKA
MQAHFTFNTQCFPQTTLTGARSSMIIPSSIHNYLPPPPSQDDEDDIVINTEEYFGRVNGQNTYINTCNGPVTMDAALSNAMNGMQESAEVVIQSLVRYCPAQDKRIVEIEFEQLQRLLEATRKKEGWSWLLEMIIHVQTRMVQGDVTRRTTKFSLGIAKEEYVEEWFGMMDPTSMRKSERQRRIREAGGDFDHDTWQHMKFSGEKVNNIPIAPKGWNRFSFERKFDNGNPSEFFHFSLDTITFSYCFNTHELQASFAYSVFSPRLVQGEGFVWAPC